MRDGPADHKTLLERNEVIHEESSSNTRMHFQEAWENGTFDKTEAFHQGGGFAGFFPFGRGLDKLKGRLA